MAIYAQRNIPLDAEHIQGKCEEYPKVDEQLLDVQNYKRPRGESIAKKILDITIRSNKIMKNVGIVGSIWELKLLLNSSYVLSGRTLHGVGKENQS